MKFHWFHLMPYPALPEDFKQRYHSVWVDLPAREVYDPQIGHTAYNDYLDELEFAGEVGFDGICVNEHHSNAYGLMPSPNLMAAALARRTTKAKLVVLGNSVALYNPPTRVAEEMAMLDVMSGGRLVAGFPVGTPMDTAHCMGANPVTLRDKYYEGVDLDHARMDIGEAVPVQRQIHPVAHRQLLAAADATAASAGVDSGRRLDRDLGLVRRARLSLRVSFLFRLQDGADRDEGLLGGGRARGPRPQPLSRRVFCSSPPIAEDDAHAEELYSEAALYFYDRCMHIYPGFATAPGYSSTATLRKGMLSQVTSPQRAARPTSHKPPPRRPARADGRTADMEDDRRQRLHHRRQRQEGDRADRDVARPLNVGHLMLLLHFGNLKKETVLYNTRRFAQEVMPKVRATHEKWEDRWWPRAA